VHRDLDPRHDDVVMRMIARDPGARPADAFAARRALLGLSWPSTNQPAAPRARERAPSERPHAGRADLASDGTGFDRWIERRFEHVALDDRSKARASAFACAGHAALQGVLRVDRESSRIWLEAVKGRPLAPPLTAPQAERLRAALEALHAAGVVHGHVDAEHVAIEDDGTPVLRFTASCDATATIDRDRLALARLSGS
jgi:serine/threonine-protein kinase